MEINLNNKPFEMKPTFACIEKIEINTGKGIYELLHNLNLQNAKLQDITTIIFEGIRASNPKDTRFTKADIGQMIIKDGCMTHFVNAINFLGEFLKGSENRDEDVGE